MRKEKGTGKGKGTSLPFRFAIMHYSLASLEN